MSHSGGTPIESTKSAAGSTGATTSLVGAFALYHKAADWDFYNLVADRIGLPNDPPAALLGHFAGETGEHLNVVDLWTDMATMESFFTDFLAGAITDAIAIVDRRADIEPKHQVTARVVLGPLARDFLGVVQDTRGGTHPDHNSRTIAIGYVMHDPTTDDRAYMEACERLGFPDQAPDGMILHLAGAVNDGWLFFDAWTDDRLAEEWYRRIAGEVLGAGDSRSLTDLIYNRRIELKRIVLSSNLLDSAG